MFKIFQKPQKPKVFAFIMEGKKPNKDGSLTNNIVLCQDHGYNFKEVFEKHKATSEKQYGHQFALSVVQEMDIEELWDKYNAEKWAFKEISK